MPTIQLHVGMASQYFMTDPKQNLALLDNPYMVFSKNVLTKTLLSEMLMRIYNIEHTKGFFGTPPQAEKEKIEKFLEELIHERPLSLVCMGTLRPLLILSKGIEKQALFALKVLKIRGLLSLAAVNMRGDAKAAESIEAAEEIKRAEIYRDGSWMVSRPSRSRAVLGRHKTVVTTDRDFKTLLRENQDMIVPYQGELPPSEKHQLVDEGVYDS